MWHPLRACKCIFEPNKKPEHPIWILRYKISILYENVLFLRWHYPDQVHGFEKTISHLSRPIYQRPFYCQNSVYYSISKMSISSSEIIPFSTSILTISFFISSRSSAFTSFRTSAFTSFRISAFTSFRKFSFKSRS